MNAKSNDFYKRRTDFRKTPAYVLKLALTVGIIASLVCWAF